METVSLMKRKDSKFVFNISELPKILNEFIQEYKVLQINNHRLLLYNTAYYDTPDLDLYYMHHNERLNRFKIREREYCISEDFFLEVKRKNNKKVTSKRRVKSKLEKDDANLFSDNRKSIKKCTDFDVKKLEIKLNNSFYRITLANFDNNERLTIDLFLKLYNEEKSVELNSLVIGELKQDAMKKSFSLAQRIFKEHGIRPNRISKYCIGTVLLNDNIKYNRFKPKLLTLNKICDGELNIK